MCDYYKAQIGMEIKVGEMGLHLWAIYYNSYAYIATGMYCNLLHLALLVVIIIKDDVHCML